MRLLRGRYSCNIECWPRNDRREQKWSRNNWRCAEKIE